MQPGSFFVCFQAELAAKRIADIFNVSLEIQNAQADIEASTNNVSCITFTLKYVPVPMTGD